jgi:pimeloyl-ACP methyl ester carboxylesterase
MGTIRRVFLLWSVGVLSVCVGDSGFARPPNGPYESFRIKTDNIPQAEIAGWLLPANGHAEGTLFILHGYNNNKEFVVGWEWVRDKENWNVVMIDFREHGDSTRTSHLSTLGYYEIWDVKAAVDYAESKGLAKPYAIFGRSLGASTGLRWASMDPRICGVFAVSPFRNAYLASQQLPASRLHISTLPSPFTWSPGFRRMLEEVDVPKAVAARDDLRIWIMSGEFDSFPPADEQAILDASRSPPEMKRFVIAPGCTHHNVWTFKGDATHPSHDQCLKDFLKACRADQPAWAARWVLGIAGVFGGGFIALAVYWRRNAKRRSAESLPPPATAVDPAPG